VIRGAPVRAGVQFLDTENDAASAVREIGGAEKNESYDDPTDAPH